LILWAFGLTAGLLWGWLPSRKRTIEPCLTVSGLPLILVVALIALVAPFCPPAWGTYVFLANHGALCVLLLHNRRLPGLGLAAAGAILNLLAMLSAGGRMPVHEMVPYLNEVTHAYFTGHPLNWLGDWIAIGLPLPYQLVVSPGDLLITLGIIRLVRAFVLSSRAPQTGRNPA
jgi:hypothetical protein